MTLAKKTNPRIKTFVMSIQRILTALPTEEEKQELHRELGQLKEFLTDMQRNLAMMPTADSMAEASKSLQKVVNLMSIAREKPVLASILGLKHPISAKRTKSVITEEDIEKAKRVVVELEALPLDDLRTKLQSDRSYSVSDLRAIASVMGIRPTQRLSRNSLLHQITMKIANFKGYQQLSGV